MLHPVRSLIATLALGVAAHGAAFAQASPVGLWRTIDDNTKQERSLIRLTEAGGVVSGKIEKIADASKQDAKCDKCTDDRKDKPIIGMELLRGLKKGDDEAWEGGTIVDPDNGKIYKARLRLIEGGSKLEVRGYLGPFYRTQVWVKAN